MFFRQLARPLRRSRARFPFLSPTVTSSPGAGEVFPQRESQAVKFITKVLGITRKFPAVLLPLPLGEVDLRSKDGEGGDADRIFFHKKGLLHETLCSSPLGSVSAADAHAKQRKRFSIYALRPARPLPALFSLRTRSFWCLRWLGVSWGSFASPARLPVWAASGSMRSSVHS